MPTIYTEDPVAKAVEDHALGTQGVYTGSVANSIGLNEHQRRSNAIGTYTYGSTIRVDHSGGPSYELLPFFQTILDAILRWVYLLFAVAGGVAAFLLSGPGVHP